MSFQLEAVRSLNRLPIFAGMSDEETYEIIRMSRIHRVATGETLFVQGDIGRSLFILESGKLAIELEKDDGTRELVAEFGPGDAIGELALIDPEPRSATATATAETVVYEINGDDFGLLTQSMNPAAYKLVRQLTKIVCRRIRSVNHRIEAQLLGNPEPPVHTGEFDRVPTEQRKTLTADDAGEGGAARRANIGTGMFRRLVAKIMGAEQEEDE